MSRIILTAGKGGVGKSTVAAATAAVCAARGLRTLVMSIDSAHNLSDLFQTPLGFEPVPIQGKLHGLEVDINRELAANWHSVTDFLRSMTASNPRVSELVAEECAVLPGMEEVFGLMRLQSVVESGQFDLIVVDTPPTGDLLKFLRLPDVLEWFMEKYRPFDRTMIQRIRPLAEVLNWPVPTEGSRAEMEQWYARVKEASATLTDPKRVSARLVMTPERVGLAETRRALSWTCLLGMNVDAVVINRIIPDEEFPATMGAWRSRQQEVLADTETAFAGLPLLRAHLRTQEVLGLEELASFGEDLYQGKDPAGLWSEEPPVQWREAASEAELRLRLPFLKKGEFRLLCVREGLSLEVGNQRRIFPLPPAVSRRKMLSARYDEGWLTVKYAPEPATH